ncbi:nicotinate-nucleotide adenylyltransferase [Neisseriaceae bacterium B1]
MNNIGLFGGTFDPIHNGHLHIAQAFAEQVQLNSVIFLPAGEPYHKNSARIAAAHRLAMVEAAIAHESRFAVSDIDIVRDGATYTIDTIQIFKQHFPSAQLWFLMGMDSLMQLYTWKNWQTLVRQTNIAVAARENTALQNAPAPLQNAPAPLHSWLGDALNNGSLKLLTAPEYDVSSTQIRAAIAAGQSTAQWLPESVANYIRVQGLYQK